MYRCGCFLLNSFHNLCHIWLWSTNAAGCFLTFHCSSSNFLLHLNCPDTQCVHMCSICKFTMLVDPIHNWTTYIELWHLFHPTIGCFCGFSLQLCRNMGHLKGVIISVRFLPSPSLLFLCALFVLLVLALNSCSAIRLHNELSASVITVSGCTVAKTRWRREDAAVS